MKRFIARRVSGEWRVYDTAFASFPVSRPAEGIRLQPHYPNEAAAQTAADKLNAERAS